MLEHDFIHINVAKDFNDFVMGRCPEDSDFNATDFRNDLLIPAIHELIKNKRLVLIVNFSGVYSNPSFLEEAFGGLVRDGVDCHLLLNRVSVQNLEDDDAMDYINEECQRVNKKKRSTNPFRFILSKIGK